MKKIYSFVALMMLLFVGNAQAQTSWDDVRVWSLASGDLATEISTDKYYVIQEGAYASWSGNAYISTEGMVSEVVSPAVFQFVAAGEKECENGTYPLYYLQNVTSKLYLSSGDTRWVKGKSKAWKFGARIAEEKAWEEEFTWEDWSNAINGGDRNGAANGQAFVFTEDNDNSVVYMNYVGEPGFMSYWDTNDWFVYEVVEGEANPYEKFSVIYNEYFGGNFVMDETQFPIGTNPGCVSQEVYTQLEAAYLAASDAMGEDSQTEEYYKAIVAQIEAAFKALEEGLVKVGPGYYVLVNQRSQDAMYEDNRQVKHTAALGVPAEWNAANAKYIWEVVESEEEGRFYFRSFSTGNYLGALKWQSSGVTGTTVEAEVSYKVVQASGKYFALIDEAGNQAHNAAQMTLVAWNDLSATGGQYEFATVPADVIATLKAEVEQALLNAELEELVSEAEDLAVSYINLNGLTYDDKYNSAGLVSEFKTCNATETREGSEAAAFDGNLTSYYHTSWNASEAPQADWHWVQVDFGKEVQEMIVKFSQRHNNRNGNPSRVAFVTYGEGEDPEAEIWGDTLWHDTIIYQYATNFDGTTIDSTTTIFSVDFGRPVQEVRMAVTRTKANQIYGYGPCWHVSELRFYEDLGENPRYYMIPQEVRDALDAAIAAGKAELADSVVVATQATIDALEDAMDAFVDAYPSPERLENLIEEAEAHAAAAEEGDEIGYFQVGAKDALLAAVEVVKAVVADEEKYLKLTLAEIEGYEKTITDALEAFANALIKPEAGIYRIISTSINDETGEDRAQTGAYVGAANADLAGAPIWGFKATEDDEYATRWNIIWEVTKNDKGQLAFRNLATGRYLNNKFEGADDDAFEAIVEESGRTLNFSETPVYFTLESAKIPGEFVAKLTDGQYLNLDPVGVVVTWGDANDVNARFTFEEVDELEGEYLTLSATANKLNVYTLPYDVVAGGDDLLQVAGRSEEAITDEDGITFYELYLTYYDEEAVVPAGTPFFYLADAEETYFSPYHPTVESLEDLVAMEHVYEGKVQNGVMGTNKTFEVEAGYGLFSGNEIVVSEEGDECAAGTALVGGADQISVFEGTADDAVVTLQLPVEVTGGNLTAIENVLIVKEAAKGVYAISGVKVRNNGNVNGLPKGLYIVNGKKVLVK